MLQDGQGRFYEFFNVTYIPSLIRGGERNSSPFMSGSAGAPNPVHVVLRIIRKIKIYDRFYPDNIYPPGRYIGRDEYSVLSPFKTLKRFPPLSERTI